MDYINQYGGQVTSSVSSPSSTSDISLGTAIEKGLKERASFYNYFWRDILS